MAPDETGDDNDEEDTDNREGGKYWRLQVGIRYYWCMSTAPRHKGSN